MGAVEVMLGVLLIAVILWDAFETIVLPRRVNRRLRLASLFSRLTWGLWAWAAGRLPRAAGLVDGFLGLYGPLAVLGLVVLWAAGLVVGFALVQLGLGAAVTAPATAAIDFPLLVYLSGTTFFTLGMGDVTPQSAPARLVTLFETAMGFSFLALIIGYIPALFSNFTQRQVAITLLDARAGSPPSALALLTRHAHPQGSEPLVALLHEWETWTADLLGSYLSYPLLAHFRSQHEGESWLASLTLVLDVCALLVVGVGHAGQESRAAEQARFTFAIARHAAGDLSQILDTPPRPDTPDRLPPADLVRLRVLLDAAGIPLREGAAADLQLARLRALYEPYVAALAARLLLVVPPWMAAPDAVDDWETTAWDYDPAPARAAFGETI